MKLTRLQQILDRAPSKRIIVIGDLMLDEFVWGKVARISPEAPVPVVEVTGESFFPGGAANVARNLREFIERVAVVGLFGKDRSGRQLRDLLADKRSTSPMRSRTRRFAPSSKPASSHAISKSFVSIASSLSAHRPPKLQGSSPRFEKNFRKPTRSSLKITVKAS